MSHDSTAKAAVATAANCSDISFEIAHHFDDTAVTSHRVRTTALPVREGIVGRTKRAEDVIFGIFLLAAVSPLLLLCAIAIKLDSRGPVLFKQKRFGYGGVPFHVYKFRTMYAFAADNDCREQTGPRDPRVTRLGRLLRRHSLDELPQLVNVLMGQMSLVGPRPHALATNIEGVELEEVCDYYRLRYLAKPGITGLAQVNGWRGALDTREKLLGRLAHDVNYICNWSIGLDLYILLRTVLFMIHDAHAF